MAGPDAEPCVMHPRHLCLSGPTSPFCKVIFFIYDDDDICSRLALKGKFSYVLFFGEYSITLQAKNEENKLF